MNSISSDLLVAQIAIRTCILQKSAAVLYQRLFFGVMKRYRLSSIFTCLVACFIVFVIYLACFCSFDPEDTFVPCQGYEDCGSVADLVAQIEKPAQRKP